MMLTKIAAPMLDLDFAGEIDVMQYALGRTINDGDSHPLSGVFSTLADAQAIYPFATSLTDELAWAAIQSAVNVAAQNTFGGAVSFGGTVVLPRGTLNLGQNTVRVASHFVAIRGQGYLATRVTRSATTGYAFHYGFDTPSNIFYTGLSSMMITSTVAMTAGGMVLFDVANFSMIRDVRLVNGFINLHCKSVHDFHIDNVNGVHGSPYAVGAAFANLYLDTQTVAGSYNPNNNGWVTNCNFRSFTTDDGYSQYAMYISSADGVWFDHCHFGNGETANASIIPKTGSSQLSGLTFSNCWFDQGGNGRMVNVGGATSATFGYFQFADCYLTGGTTCTEGYRFDPTAGTVVRHVEITGGKVMNLKSNGLVANRTEGLTLTGTQFRNIASDGGGAAGIIMGGTCKHWTITGVPSGYRADLSTPAGASYGMVIASGADYYIITGCNFRGNTTGTISDGGGTNKEVANNLI